MKSVARRAFRLEGRSKFLPLEDAKLAHLLNLADIIKSEEDQQRRPYAFTPKVQMDIDVLKPS